MIRTAKFANGKLVYDPPYTAEELAQKDTLFAEMCQARQAPGTTGSDRAFMEGQVLNHGFEKGDLMANHYVATAKRAGIDIQGKVYRGCLADGRGPADPMAWIGSRDDAMYVAKARNLTTHGSIEHKGHETPPDPEVPLNPRIVKRLSEQYIAQDPKLARDPVEVAEMVVEKHGSAAPKRARSKPWKKPANWVDL